MSFRKQVILPGGVYWLVAAAALCAFATAFAQPFQLADDALYLYRTQVYGVWGPSGASLPPLATQMEFQQRVSDYPCCPEAGFHQPGKTDPGVGHQLQDLKGFTEDPASGRINLLVPMISLDFMRPATGGIAFGNTYIASLPVATVRPLAATGQSNPRLRHFLRFEFLPDFTIRMLQAPSPDEARSVPAHFQDVGSSDVLRREGYFLIQGNVRLPGGLPIAGGRARNPKYPSFLHAMPGWHQHYDIVLETEDRNKKLYAPVNLYNFWKGDNRAETRIDFAQFARFNTVDATRLSTLAGATQLSFRRKAWGALSSRPGDLCVLPGCLMLSDRSNADESNKRKKIRPGKDDADRPDRLIIDPGRNKKKPIKKPVKDPVDALVRHRLFTPELGPRSGDWLHVPARLSFRLVAAPGSDLTGVELNITAFRKSDNRVTRAAVRSELYHRFLSTYHQPEFDPALHAGGVPGFPVLRESRTYLSIDDVPGTEYGITCTIVYRSMGYQCTAGRPAENIKRLSLIQESREGSGQAEASRDFRNFEEAFASYRVGMPYADAREYGSMRDAYPLFEIEFRKGE
jgi:hypothetical protein